MSGWEIAQAVVTAVSLAIIFGVAKLFQRINTLETQTKPLLTWFEKVSLDALRIATNPTDERLAELAQRYIVSVTGSGKMSASEKQELIDGLRGILRDARYPEKRQAASMSLRFIEQREGLSAKKAANTNH